MHEFSSGATGPWAKQWGELNSDELAAAMLLGYRDHVLWRDRNKASADESAQDGEVLSEAQLEGVLAKSAGSKKPLPRIS